MARDKSLAGMKYSSWLPPSSIDKARLDGFVKQGRLPAPVGRGECLWKVPPAGATRSRHFNDGVVFFSAQLVAGLCFPVSDFLYEFLTYYQCELFDLNPSVFVRLSVFVWALRTMRWSPLPGPLIGSISRWWPRLSSRRHKAILYVVRAVFPFSGVRWSIFVF